VHRLKCRFRARWQCSIFRELFPGGRLISGTPARVARSPDHKVPSIFVTSTYGMPRMKIAQISPLIESVPPRLYGGTERVVSYLTEALVAQGHDVTLFASGDSVTAAQLVPCCAMALRLDPASADPVPHYMLMLDKVMARAADFDILHF